MWDAGDAAAPLDPTFPPPLVGNCWRPCVHTDRQLGRARSARFPTAYPSTTELDALVVATSGASGEPEGVVLTHDAVAAVRPRATSSRLGIDPDHVTAWLACLPLAHIGGLAVVTRSIVTDTPVIVLPGFEAEAEVELGPRRKGLARLVGGDRTATGSTPLCSPVLPSGTARYQEQPARQRRRHVRHDRDRVPGIVYDGLSPSKGWRSVSPRGSP